MQLLLKEDGGRLLFESGGTVVLRRTIVTPVIGLQGANPLSVYIESEDAVFDATSVASFSGTGITVIETKFVDTTHVKLLVEIDDNAAPTARDLTVTTGAVSVFSSGAFTIRVPGAETSATAAFQYTLLTRGNDIRRTPGITIHDALNNTPNQCAFTIDGTSNTPVIGEKIEIRDSFDDDRLMFSGTVQSIEQVYEGQIDQIAWKVSAIDFTWLLNRKRPFGSYRNISVSKVVTELVNNYAPGFTTNHVQTNLAKVTITLDGSEDLVTVFNKLAAAIGGGHWYVDYQMDVHFFHVVPSSLALPPSEFETLDKHITLALGGPVTTPYKEGMYFLRHTFLYSDGSESKYGAISNLVYSHGTEKLLLSTIPIGSTRGNLTCVGRRIYYNQFLADPTHPKDPIEKITAFCQIDDNTTTEFSTDFGAVGASNPNVHEMIVNKIFTTTSVPNPLGYVELSNQAAKVALNSPIGEYSSLLEEPVVAPTILQSRVVSSSFTPGVYRFSETWITSGVESSPGPDSADVSLSGSKAVDFSNVVVGPGGTTKRKLYFKIRTRAIDTSTPPPPASTLGYTTNFNDPANAFSYTNSPANGFPAGVYSWATSYNMISGLETAPSPLVTFNVVTPVGNPYAQLVTLWTDHTNAPAGALTYNIYRTDVNGPTLKLVIGGLTMSGINNYTGAHTLSPGHDGHVDATTNAHLGRDAAFASTFSAARNFATLFENALTLVTKGMNGDGSAPGSGGAGPGSALIAVQSATNDIIDLADIPSAMLTGVNYQYKFSFSATADHSRETIPSIASVSAQTTGHALIVDCPSPTVEDGINFVQLYRTEGGSAGPFKFVGSQTYISKAAAQNHGLPNVCAEFVDTLADGSLGSVPVALGRIPQAASGWMGFKGTDWLASSTAHPLAGPFADGNVVYFASIDVADKLETIASITPVPTTTFNGHPAGPTTGPSATAIFVYGEGYFNGNWVQYKVAFLYRDGSVSFPSPASNSAGTKYMVQGQGIVGYTLTGIPIGEDINGNDVVARFIYNSTGLLQNPNFSVNYIIPVGGLWPVPFNEPTWADSSVASLIIIPNNTSTTLGNFSLASSGTTFPELPGVTGAFVSPGLNKPYNNGTILSTDPIPVWPNPDGPSLEDINPPNDITNENEDLLHEDSGSQPFTVYTDLSQVRNRIFVVGSGSTVVATAKVNDRNVQIADVSNFSPNGGRVKIEDPASGTHVVLPYDGVTGVTGTTFIVMSGLLATEIAQGSIVNNFFQADDIDSQKDLAKAELDANGRETDGIHEFTIVDGTLKAVFQLYMRAYAELELFSRPIKTVKYATRDPLSTTGQTVHIDITNPPCKGDFLIQDVTIDQFHDESDDLMPRYTVIACSVHYTLNDLLLQILGNSMSGGSSSSGGIALSAVTASSDSSASNSVPIAPVLLRRPYIHAYVTFNATTPTTIGSASFNSLSAVPSNLKDAITEWYHFAATSGQQLGYQSLTMRHNWLPRMVWAFRTGPSVANSRWWCGTKSGSISGFMDNDILQASGVPQKGIGVRFSTVAGDQGWTPYHAQGDGTLVNTHQTMYAPVSQVLPNTLYVIDIEVLSSSSWRVTINGLVSAVFPMHPDLLFVDINTVWVGLGQGVPLQADWRSFYAEIN